MPSPIPVVLDQIRFASQNQARAHFSQMLHRYEPGQKINPGDTDELRSLLKRHPAFARSRPEDVSHYRVEVGRYGRRCFAATHIDSTSRAVSFVQCVRHPAQAGPPSLTTLVESQPKKETPVSTSQAQPTTSAKAPVAAKPAMDGAGGKLGTSKRQTGSKP